MFTVENFLEYYAKHKNILLKLDFTKVSKPKLVSFIGSLIKQKVSLEELKIVFRSIDSEEVENIYSRITKRIQKSNDKRHFQELRELGKEERERVERENQLDEAGLIDLDILSEEEEEEEADGSDNGDHFEAVGQYL